MRKKVKRDLNCMRQNNLSLTLMILISLLKNDVQQLNVR